MQFFYRSDHVDVHKKQMNAFDKVFFSEPKGKD